ncbi:MAG: YajD family HNH nuclease [Gammaproteobacteria bacterium]|nr:YajD family HNH nuclease [Gammaproteobacteria bacterium]
MPVKKTSINKDKLDKVVAEALKNRKSREQDYRAKALKMYAWICGRCEREFNRQNLVELTVHHRNHDHDDNPEDGSNWELLCTYCHDNEHSRFADLVRGDGYSLHQDTPVEVATGNPFADLKAMMNNKNK